MKNKTTASVLGILFIFLVVLLPAISAFNWVDPSLISYYKLDETSGSTAIDSINYNNGTSVAVILNLTGKIGKAYDFNTSTSSVISLGTPANIPRAYNSPVTVCSWFNMDSLASGGIYMITGDSSGKFEMSLDVAYSANLLAEFSVNKQGQAAYPATGTTPLSIGQWYFACGSFDGTANANGVKFYLNGINEANNTYGAGVLTSSTTGATIGNSGRFNTNYFRGKIDELGIWNRVLNSSEILELYNNGTGMTYNTSGILPSVTLISPTNGTTLSTIGSNFTTIYNISGTNTGNYSWKNATYNIWTSNGTIFNQTTVSLTGNNTLNTLYIDAFSLGNYYWNVYACYGNATYNNCTWSSNGNYSYFVGATINSITFNSTALGGTMQTFSIDINYASSLLTSSGVYVLLNYNGTNYTTTATGNSTELVFSRSINVPNPNITTSYPVYFTIVLSNSGGNVYLQSNISNQNVSTIFVGVCGGSNSYAALNYTLRDETSDTSMSGGINTNVLIYSADGLSLVANYSNQFAGVSNATICINNSLVGSAYSLFAETTYYATSYSTRHNYIQNFSLGSSNIPQNTTLYLLPANASTTFQMNFRGNTLSGLSGVLLNIQRQYLGQNGIYKTVEIEKTDNYGIGIGYFDLVNNGIYSITATLNGKVIATFPSISLYCITSQACQINLYAAPEGSALVNTNNLYGLNYNANFNTTSRIVTTTFSTMDSSVSTFRLYVTTDAAIAPTICNSSITTSAGTLSCLIPLSYGNTTVIAYLYQDENGIQHWVWDMGISNFLGGNTVMIFMLFFLTLVTMFIPDIRWVILVDGVGFLLASMMFGLEQGLFNHTNNVSGANTALVSLVWLFVAIVIIIVKYRSRE